MLQFIGGHGDVTLGMLSIKGKALAQRLYFLQVLRRLQKLGCSMVTL